MSRIAAAAIGPSEGFAADRRFAKPASPPPLAPTADPVATAWAEGYAEGSATAEVQAQALAEELAAALGRIELAFARLDMRRKRRCASASTRP